MKERLSQVVEWLTRRLKAFCVLFFTAVIDMARPAASDPSLDSEAVADGSGMSCMAAPAPVFASPRPAETFKRASTYDELDPLQEANAAKRRYIGISPEQQPEVRLRMEVCSFSSLVHFNTSVQLSVILL